MKIALQIRMEEELHGRIALQAKRDGRTVSEWCRGVLEEKLDVKEGVERCVEEEKPRREVVVLRVDPVVTEAEKVTPAVKVQEIQYSAYESEKSVEVPVERERLPYNPYASSTEEVVKDPTNVQYGAYTV